MNKPARVGWRRNCSFPGRSAAFAAWLQLKANCHEEADVLQTR